MADFRIEFSIEDTTKDIVKTIKICCGMINKRDVDFEFYFKYGNHSEYLGDADVSALSEDNMIEVAEDMVGKSTLWLTRSRKSDS